MDYILCYDTIDVQFPAFLIHLRYYHYFLAWFGLWYWLSTDNINESKYWKGGEIEIACDHRRRSLGDNCKQQGQM